MYKIEIRTKSANLKAIKGVTREEGGPKTDTVNLEQRMMLKVLKKKKRKKERKKERKTQREGSRKSGSPSKMTV